jgi:hypothetical protein
MLHRDFKEFVASFNARGVEYFVVGGYALAAHGRPRYTGDIDLWVRPTADNAKRVMAALADLGFAALTIIEADLVKPGNVIQLGNPPRRKRATGRIQDLADLEALDDPAE